MNLFSTSFKISIAEIIIQLNSDEIIELESGYEPFLVETDVQTNIQVTCKRSIPEVDFDQYTLAFEAKNDSLRFYSIYQTGNEYCFIIYSQQNAGEIQHIAYLNSRFDKWTIFSKDAVALKYPMGPIIMHYLTLYTDAVLMHASCAYDGKKGRMFSGFSGAGKSTMSRIWAESGAMIVNDDRLVIRKVDEHFFVYNTPMYYVDKSKKAPLDAIYLIRHSPVNIANKLTGATAVSKVMAFCIQNNFERKFISKRLAFFDALCAAVPTYELGVVPTADVITYIIQNEQHQS